MWEAVVDATNRAWGFHYNVLGIHPDFRTDNGFLPRTGYVKPNAANRFTWYGTPGALVERFNLFANVNGLWRYDDFFRARALLEDGASAERPAPGELTEAGLEALLFVAEKPLSRREIGSIAGVDPATVDARLGDLEVTLRGRGIRLLVTGDRVELATAPETGALVARYVGADAVRLSPAGLETLAIIAYRQPVTKSAVERIRGVDSDHTVRSLLHRRLVVELGRANTPGRPILYGTAFEFLERFGLESLDDIPTLDADVAARLAEEGGALLLPLDDLDADGEPAFPAGSSEATPGPFDRTSS